MLLASHRSPQVMHWLENGKKTKQSDKDQNIIFAADKSGLDTVSKWLKSTLG